MPRDGLRAVTGWLAGAGVLIVGVLAALVTPSRPEPATVARGHEPSDVSIVGVLAVTGGLVAGLALALVLASWLQVRLTGYEVRLTPPAGGLARPAAEPPAFARESGPRPLSGTPADELAALRQAEAQRLAGYGWVNREAGIARIPIDVALDILGRRGLPSRPGAPPPAVAAPSASGRFVERAQP